MGFILDWMLTGSEVLTWLMTWSVQVSQQNTYPEWPINSRSLLFIVLEAGIYDLGASILGWGPASSVFSLYPHMTKRGMGVLWEAFQESTDLIHEGTTLITWSLPKGFHLLIPSTLGVRISRYGFWRDADILTIAIGLGILISVHRKGILRAKLHLKRAKKHKSIILVGRVECLVFCMLDNVYADLCSDMIMQWLLLVFFWTHQEQSNFVWYWCFIKYMCSTDEHQNMPYWM